MLVIRLPASLGADPNPYLALAVSLTVHARQDGGTGICNDFAHAVNPCVHAGMQIGMAYVASLLGESAHTHFCGRAESKLTVDLVLRASPGRLHHFVDRQVSRRRQGDAAVPNYQGAQLAFRGLRP